MRSIDIIHAFSTEWYHPQGGEIICWGLRVKKKILVIIMLCGPPKGYTM
jgi:hypothetical protein